MGPPRRLPDWPNWYHHPNCKTWRGYGSESVASLVFRSRFPPFLQFDRLCHQVQCPCESVLSMRDLVDQKYFVHLHHKWFRSTGTKSHSQKSVKSALRKTSSH